MKIQVIRSFTKVAIVAAFLISFGVQAQWSGVYGNEWLAGKYGQEWLRIGVSLKGVQKVTLPDAFKNKSGDLHLYHRGVEVALISASNTEIEFYGVPNDGASDALLYRPFTGVRANPYYSWFSDESAYFLTHSTGVPTKLLVTEPSIAPSGTVEPYHLQRDITLYTNDYTHDSQTNGVVFSLDQSYYDEGKAMTGSGIYKANLIYYDNGVPVPYSIGDPVFNFPFVLKNVVRDIALKPKFEVLINNRTNSGHSVKSSVGKTSGSLRDFTDIQFSIYGASKREFTLNASTTLGSSDVDENGNGVFRWEALTQTNDIVTTGFFSFAYIQRIYPQLTDMLGLQTNYFNFPAASGTHSRIQITNAPSGARVYDISDPHSPRYIPSTLAGSVLELMAERISNQELNLVVITSGLANSNLSPVTFTSYDPTLYDYLVVTNNTLFDAGGDFAAYRNSVEGGSYKSLVVKIKDIYNQFNYGEPSPVALRRYVDFMVKRAPKPKHNLLLVGPSTTIPRFMHLNRELPEEVPTIGYPGSDVLLVEGLADGFSESPAIPVGRISATTLDQVTNYLNKVKAYEGATKNVEWRKKALHISGGLHLGENTKFAKYLDDYNYYITGVTFGGSVATKVKPDGDYGYPSNAMKFDAEINAGIGFSAYYGHGNATQTDNNIGYATDPGRLYSNVGKYPLLYFNGCGVGNIFSGRFSPYPGTNSSVLMPLSTDWVLADSKGAIAVIANSYYAFEESSKIFVGALHQNLFKTDADRLTIGRIHQASGKMIADGYEGARIAAFNLYDIANNHQTLLQGDPALKVLNVPAALPVSLLNWAGKLTVDAQVSLTWETEWEENNGFFEIQRSIDARKFEKIGLVEGRGDSDKLTNYSFLDVSPKRGVNYYRLVQTDNISGGGKTTTSRVIKVDNSNGKSIIIMPNPSSDFVKIDIGDETIETVNILNTKGQILKSGHSENKISLKELGIGSYVVEVKTLEGNIYKRTVVKY